MEKVLVKYIYVHFDDSEEMISSYWTTQPDQMLKTLITAKENSIELVVNDCSTVVDEKYKTQTFLIDSINVGIPSEEDLFTILVYVV